MKCQNYLCTNLVSTKPGSTGKYCSLSCSTANRNRKRAAKMKERYILNPKHCRGCNSALLFESRSNKFCSASCSATFNNAKRAQHGWKHSPRTIKLMSEWACQNPRGVIVNQPSRPKKEPVRRTCKECSTEFFIHPSNKKKYCSKTCADKHRGGFRTYKQLLRNESYFCGYKMDSGAEKYFATLLNEKGIQWIKNDFQWKKKFPYKKVNNRWLYYYPDFYLPQLNLWIEIKGKRYQRHDDQSRYNAVPNHVLVMYDAIKDYVELIGNGASQEIRTPTISMAS